MEVQTKWRRTLECSVLDLTSDNLINKATVMQEQTSSEKRKTVLKFQGGGIFFRFELF